MRSDGVEHSVLLVIMDTVRADSIRSTDVSLAPTLDALADSGTSFERAIAPAPWTLASHSSMFTGTYPTEHGMTNVGRTLPETYDTIAERLDSAGYRTGLFTANGFLTENFGIDRGFQRTEFVHQASQRVYDDAFDVVRYFREHDVARPRRAVPDVTRQILTGNVAKNLANLSCFGWNVLRRRVDASYDHSEAWDEQAVQSCEAFVRESGEEPFFAVVNLVQAHGPWSFDREKLDAIGVTPEDVAPVETWEWMADHSEGQLQYAAGEVEFSETERTVAKHLYRSWIHSVDRLAGRLVEAVEDAGVREETAVVLTSDHGECFGTDGVFGHEFSVDEEVANVPLVVDGPGVPETAVSNVVSLKDLYGTILSIAGCETDDGTVFDDHRQGEALIETTGIDPERVDPAYEHLCGDFGLRRAFYTDEGSVQRRYDRNEVLGDERLLDRLDALVETLESKSVAAPRDGALNSDVQFRLSELGYVE